MAFYMGKGKYPYSALNSPSLNCVWLLLCKALSYVPSTNKRAERSQYRESAFLKVVQSLDFITVKVDNTSLNKYLVEKQESMFKDITEIAGNFVLIPSQNSYEDFLMKPIPVNQTAYF